MENVLFKQTFRGFDRSQVLEYIDNISAQMSQQAEEYSKVQKGLEDEIQSLSQRLSQSKDNLSMSRDTLEKLQEELRYLKQNNDELKRRVTNYRNMILVRDKQISEIKTDYEKLSAHSHQLEEENTSWKARQDEIASCMVEANLRAKQIIRDAQSSARQTKRQFEANAANLMDKVSDVRGEVTRLESELEESFNRLANVIEAMDKASANIEQQVHQYYDKVEVLDDFPVPQPKPEAEKPQQTKPVITRVKQPVKKQSLTDSVLDKITKLLEK